MLFSPIFPSLLFHFSLFVLSRWKESLSILRRVLDPKINCLTMYLLHSELMSHQTCQRATTGMWPQQRAPAFLQALFCKDFWNKFTFKNGSTQTLKHWVGIFFHFFFSLHKCDIFKAVLAWYLILNPRPSTTTLEEEIRETRLYWKFFLIVLNVKMLLWANGS